MFAPATGSEAAPAQAAFWAQQTGTPALQVPAGAVLLPAELRTLLERFETLSAEHRQIGRQLRDDRRVKDAKAADRSAAGQALAAGKPAPEPTHEPKALEADAADETRRDQLGAALAALDRQAADWIAEHGDQLRADLEADAAEHQARAATLLRQATDELEQATLRRTLVGWTRKRRGGKPRDLRVHIAAEQVPLPKVLAALVRTLEP